MFILRRSNRPLWIRFTKVMSRRLILGLHTYFVKCSSHGKGGKSQHPCIGLWNDRADTWAGNFATKGPFIHDCWTEGELAYHVLHRAEGRPGRRQGAHSVAIRGETILFGSPVEDGRVRSTISTRHPRSEQRQHKVLPIGGLLGEGRRATFAFICLRLSEPGSSHAGQMLHVRSYDDNRPFTPEALMGQSALCVSASPQALGTTRRRAPLVLR
jgi:hypothetical protein